MRDINRNQYSVQKKKNFNGKQRNFEFFNEINFLKSIRIDTMMYLC